MKTIGVGLIGTGFMGKCHAMAFGAASAVFGSPLKPQLEILCDIDPDTTKSAAEEFGFARWTTDWKEVIADPAVDVVAITSPNGLHREMASAAARAGKHVYCEKPMALTFADAEDMANVAAQSGVKTLVGYNYIKNPAVLHARRMIDEGVIGEIGYFRGVYDEDYMADPTLPFSWRCRIADAGTGTLGDLACHLVSVAHFLAGPVASVCADIETIHKQRPDPEKPGATGEVENEDIAHALLRFENGIAGNIASSRVAWGRKCGLAWEVTGSRGSIVFDQERMNELRLFVADGPQTERGFKTILTGPGHPPYDRFCPASGHGLGFNELKVIEVDHLLRGIAGEETLFPDFTAALAIERVIHGIVASASKKSWVAVAQET
ncbi:MAG: Gfo/Idh/MocA family oxidoreductase [Rhodospirillales bacterium]|nr:Gfo/Idh/MocA family oxidoreductase [Rhodospirillales bacterium]